MTRRDAGAAHAGAVIVAALALGVVYALLGLGSALVARHNATGVADLTALSGAQAVLDAGADAGCPEAALTAASQGATVDACEVIAFGPYVALEVTVSVANPLRLPGVPARLSAVARAGNVSG
jgi:hypothetical protein